jgi:hypothetical protein
MRLLYSAVQQILFELRKQKIGLSASSYPSHHFDQSIALSFDQLIQIIISLDFHIHSKLNIIAGIRAFIQLL